MQTNAADASRTAAIDGLIIEEALSWIGTPYILGGHLKGVGCDCGTYLIEVFVRLGLASREEVEAELRAQGIYSHDWYLHTKAQKYLKAILKFTKHLMQTRCYPTTKAEPGSVVLTKAFGMTDIWNHGGIVIQWPKIVHAVDPAVCITNATKDAMWNFQEIDIFRVKGT